MSKASAEKMGKTWSRKTPWGYSLVIGEPLMDNDGRDKELNFEAAQKACLELNPPVNSERIKKEDVESDFVARETELEKIRGRHRDLQSKEAQVELMLIISRPHISL
jgi:hypothetical protein